MNSVHTSSLPVLILLTGVQIVHAHGVPDDHIIVMMYDDIAYNIENPTPGKIINHPNGTDVYHGVPKDYVCGSVRPDIFLQVIKPSQEKPSI